MKRPTIDIVVLLLTGVICIIMVMFALAPLVRGAELSSESKEIFGDIIKLVLAIILFYMGAKTDRRKDNTLTGTPMQ